MRQHWLTYVIVGLCFGIADWYFLDWLASFSQNPSLNDTLLQMPEAIRQVVVIAMIVSNYGVWLVPVIPIAIYEMKYSLSLQQATVSAVIVWSAALFSYYSYYTFMLMFIGLPNMEFMLFSNHQSATYWSDWWAPFKRVIIDQFVEWIGIGLIGGAIARAVSASAFNFLWKRRMQRASLFVSR